MKSEPAYITSAGARTAFHVAPRLIAATCCMYASEAGYTKYGLHSGSDATIAGELSRATRSRNAQRAFRCIDCSMLSGRSPASRLCRRELANSYSYHEMPTVDRTATPRTGGPDESRATSSGPSIPPILWPNTNTRVESTNA
jgi:hypothetical protein